MIDLLGWAATAVFVGSYFSRRPDALRRIQMIGAFMWVAYGLLMRAPPVVAANLLVIGAAAFTRSFREVNPQADHSRHNQQAQ